MEPLNGFWLPQHLRNQAIFANAETGSQSFVRGRPCEPDDEGAVTAHWPILDEAAWQRLLIGLKTNRRRAPQGRAFWQRMGTALESAARRFADPADSLHARALAALPGYTGYSEGMIRASLSALNLWTLDPFPAAFDLNPSWAAVEDWQTMPGLPGRLRFYPASRPSPSLWARLLGRPASLSTRALLAPAPPLELVVGFGAGNVPGTALMIAFLAMATALEGGPPPSIVIRNSRREPILAPLLLDALEDADPDLVASLAVLVWDHGDAAAQQQVLARADLVIAAAGDQAIAEIEGSLHSGPRPTPARFHAHGHKVSFSAIGREVLAHDLRVAGEDTLLIQAVALLAALDSVFWDQHGCLSSRVHFVEDGGKGHYDYREFAAHLNQTLSMLAGVLPRGAWPRRPLRNAFDRYKQLERTGQLQVLSGYDDDYVVIADERPLDAMAFASMVNECQGRVIVIRPVGDLMDVPHGYLSLLPAVNLQSLSVAVGRPSEGLSDGFLRFATACGARGVTAIRTVGRGAFPQLAYSWDGLIPLDLVRQRDAGHFSTIEFDSPCDEIVDTYRQFLTFGFSFPA